MTGRLAILFFFQLYNFRIFRTFLNFRTFPLFAEVMDATDKSIRRWISGLRFTIRFGGGRRFCVVRSGRWSGFGGLPRFPFEHDMLLVEWTVRRTIRRFVTLCCRFILFSRPSRVVAFIVVLFGNTNSFTLT